MRDFWKNFFYGAAIAFFVFVFFADTAKIAGELLIACGVSVVVGMTFDKLFD